MQWAGEQAHQHYLDVVSEASGALIGLDYDGTLAPLVTDPPKAFIHPDAPDLLRDLCARVRTVAIVTGRPARQAVALGRLDEIADDCPNLVVLGQYGNETWTSVDRRVISPPPPTGMAGFLRELPTALTRSGIEPWIEEKGIAVALHTRTLPDPGEAYRQLLPVMTELADRHHLVIEPGRFVMEARSAGMDKGVALRKLAADHQPSAMIFAGDDLGDIPAFQEIEIQRDGGMPALHVCSESPDEPRISEHADVILDGPDGVIAFFRQFLTDASI